MKGRAKVPFTFHLLRNINEVHQMRERHKTVLEKQQKGSNEQIKNLDAYIRHEITGNLTKAAEEKRACQRTQ